MERYRVVLMVVTFVALASCRVSEDLTRPGEESLEPEPAVRNEKPESVELGPDITVHFEPAQVVVRAWTCAPGYPLEQVACAPGSREHEALVVIRARPSDLHAALLLAGFEPGQPAGWELVDGDLRYLPPAGSKLAIFVRRAGNGPGDTTPIADWIDSPDGTPLPSVPWIFGGSVFAANPEWMGPGDHYVADQTGSIIGLATFGDEVIGFSRDISPDQANMTVEWWMHADRVPPEGTEVDLMIRKWE